MEGGTFRFGEGRDDVTAIGPDVPCLDHSQVQQREDHLCDGVAGAEELVGPLHCALQGADLGCFRAIDEKLRASTARARRAEAGRAA